MNIPTGMIRPLLFVSFPALLFFGGLSSLSAQDNACEGIVTTVITPTEDPCCFSLSFMRFIEPPFSHCWMRLHEGGEILSETTVPELPETIVLDDGKGTIWPIDMPPGAGMDIIFITPRTSPGLYHGPVVCFDPVGSKTPGVIKAELSWANTNYDIVCVENVSIDCSAISALREESDPNSGDMMGAPRVIGSGSSVMIPLTISEPKEVGIALYDVNGGKVADILPAGTPEPGFRVVQANTERLPSGRYYCVLESGGTTEVQSFAIVR